LYGWGWNDKRSILSRLEGAGKKPAAGKIACPTFWSRLRKNFRMRRHQKTLTVFRLIGALEPPAVGRV